MTLTKHIRVRCQQRGIRETDLSLIERYGTHTPEGVILTRKNVAEAESNHRHLMDRLRRLENVLVLSDGDAGITTYRATKRQRRSLLGRSPGGPDL